MANFEFTHQGWSDTGEVSGSFTGEDLNSDALISLDELSAYNMTSTLTITFGMFSHDLSALNDFSYSISSNEILSLESEAGTPSETTARTRYEATNVDGQVTTNLTVGDPNIALSSQGPSVTPLDQPPTEPPTEPGSPRIKSDFNNNGSNDVIYQQISAIDIGGDPSQAQSVFYDPVLTTFDVFTPNVNTPGLIATSIGDFDDDGDSEVLYYDPQIGSNFLLNPQESGQERWTFLQDPNNPDAILQTPGFAPTASVDLNGDGVEDLVYVNESNPDFSPGQNLTYDPITRQFNLLNVTSDITPLTGGNFDSDPAPELVYGNPDTGEYSVFNVDTEIFEPLNLNDPNQTFPGLFVTGSLNVAETEPDLILFQNLNTSETFTFNRTTGASDSLTNTPDYISLA